MITAATTPVLSAPKWRELAALHQARAEQHTRPARERRTRGTSNPISDFLFDYYRFPLSLLEKWHPGIGVALEHDGPDFLAPFFARDYSLTNGLLTADPSQLDAKKLQRLERILGLLCATRDRAPNFACHGLHEWAMVYHGKEIRHEKTLRLRLPQAEIDAVVESRPICCSHHDAFRFFAAAARPLNHLQPSLETRELMEQPGCVHANMDLYKWTAKTMPWAGTELLLDCFELAVKLRDLDMRASPYDLSAWGRSAVRIETADGRRDYEIEQRQLAAEAQPLRQRLIDRITRTIALAG